MNKGQGLGFLVGKTVIDKGKLQQFAKAIAGLASTIGPVMLAWGVTTMDGDSEVMRHAADNCSMTKQQEAALTSVFETFNFEMGCSFNITIDVGQTVSLLVNH